MPPRGQGRSSDHARPPAWDQAGCCTTCRSHRENLITSPGPTLLRMPSQQLAEISTRRDRLYDRQKNSRVLLIRPGHQFLNQSEGSSQPDPDSSLYIGSCPSGLSGWAFFKTYPSMLRLFFLMLSLNPVPLYRHVECL